MTLFTQVIATSIGEIFLTASNNALYALEFDDIKRRQLHCASLQKVFGCTFEQGINPIITQTTNELHEYLSGGRTTFSVPVKMVGTDFQKKVWSALSAIPYGVTISYEELSQQIGNPLAIRAVGTANGKNKIAIIIPCHRVVNKSGGLGGYGGGLHRKEYLLKLENASFGSTTNQDTLF